MYSENDFHCFFGPAPDNKTPVPERKKYSPDNFVIAGVSKNNDSVGGPSQDTSSALITVTQGANSRNLQPRITTMLSAVPCPYKGWHLYMNEGL